MTQLCCFAQYNGVGRPEDIGYDLLDAYDSFMRESSKAFYINEGLTVGFLAYMSSSRKCSRGLSLYMHYLESNKVSRLSGLSYHSREMIKNAQKNGTGISADELYTTMEDFVKQMTESGYSHTVTDSVKYHLILLFPFLDMGNLRYNRTTVEIWFKEEGERLFKKGILMARRTYEMYDDYIRDRVVVPSHWWKHGKNMSDRLPSWCLEWIEPFIAAKEKEGWAKNTIKMYHTCITCFCTFLTSAGIVTLDEITPKLIKEYHAWDCGHKTPEAKNAYNSRIRKFLIFLEINGVIPVGVHHALPRHVADREVIVEVLSDKDVLAIETYCKDAQTPIQLRDAAMLMLLKETGLRSCDVIGLRVTDIDWKQRSIRIIQRKTGMEHIHPLSTKAGNQLFRYIRDGRQKDTECTELFTVHKYTMLDAERMKLCPLSLSETGLLLEGRYRHD